MPERIINQLIMVVEDMNNSQNPDNIINPNDMYQNKSNMLLSCGIELFQGTNYNSFITPACNVELCRGSSLHRGYYHPSPIYDIIVGNAKRGKIVRSSCTAKDCSHRYTYTADGKLQHVESFANGKTAYTEYLIYLADKRIGLTIDCYNYLSAISEERFEMGRLASFSLANCIFDGHSYSCYNYHEEQYYYDDIGLFQCDFINFSTSSRYLINEQYSFERTNGYLSAYTNTTSHIRYAISKKRKA